MITFDLLYMYYAKGLSNSESGLRAHVRPNIFQGCDIKNEIIVLR